MSRDKFILTVLPKTVCKYRATGTSFVQIMHWSAVRRKSTAGQKIPNSQYRFEAADHSDSDKWRMTADLRQSSKMPGRMTDGHRVNKSFSSGAWWRTKQICPQRCTIKNVHEQFVLSVYRAQKRACIKIRVEKFDKIHFFEIFRIRGGKQ